MSWKTLVTDSHPEIIERLRRENIQSGRGWEKIERSEVTVPLEVKDATVPSSDPASWWNSPAGLKRRQELRDNNPKRKP